MGLLTIAILVTIFVLNVQTETKTGIKELITKVVKEQSQKINELLNKIQMNAQNVLLKLKSLNRNPILNKIKTNPEAVHGRHIETQLQIEPPTTSRFKERSRSFNSHYSTSGYGVSGSAYGGATYHHHSIGFDPLNIVLSMSLLSFFFQALQSLLANTRFPTPVIEAKTFDPAERFVKRLREKKTKKWFKHFEE